MLPIKIIVIIAEKIKNTCYRSVAPIATDKHCVTLNNKRILQKGAWKLYVKILKFNFY